MAKAIETGLYLLTPTHVGAGQAAGAIDLPIARETHTGFPLLPSSAIKGVARDLYEQMVKEKKLTDKELSDLFGSPPPTKDDGGGPLLPGDLIFTDAHLLAFPVRALTAAFYWVTCPLVIERWRRLRRAWDLEIPKDRVPDRPVATFAPSGALVLEDQVIETSGAWLNEPLKAVASYWVRLLPSEKEDTVAASLKDKLVCVSDATFSYLVQRCTTVSARVQLTDGKTTDAWEDPETGEEQKGNLWYEESLPADCLFSALIASRHQGSHARIGRELNDGRRFQIGGHETIGQGMCWWKGEVSRG